MGRGDFVWTDRAIQWLKKRHADGLTYGQIALELKLTRNAVIGKAMRLGMCRPQPPPAEPSEAPPKPARKPPPMKPLPEIPPPTQSVELPPDVSEHACTLFELEPASCRWPICDSPWLFCGATRRDDSSYCGRHHRLGHQKSTPRTTIPMAWRAP